MKQIRNVCVTYSIYVSFILKRTTVFVGGKEYLAHLSHSAFIFECFIQVLDF